MFCYAITNSLFASTVISLKMFQENYYFWFYDNFKYPENTPVIVKYCKQFSHFTDMGHIISLLSVYDYTWLPVAFNLHFVISFAYWTSKLLLGLKDDDDGNFENLNHDERPWPLWTEFWWTLNHSLPIIILTGWIMYDPSLFVFDWYTLGLSLGWLYGWFVLVYIPWRLYTGDAVYSIFNENTPTFKKIMFVLIVNGMFLTSNMVGILLTTII